MNTSFQQLPQQKPKGKFPQKGENTKQRSYQESFLKTLETQQVQWTYLHNDTDLELELISPLKATVRDYKGGGYVKFCAYVCRTTDENVLNEGDIITIQFPIKAWERAMYSIPITKKKLWNEIGEDNIYFKARKVSRTLLIIDYIERRKSTEEQKGIAKPMYENQW